MYVASFSLPNKKKKTDKCKNSCPLNRYTGSWIRQRKRKNCCGIRKQNSCLDAAWEEISSERQCSKINTEQSWRTLPDLSAGQGSKTGGMNCVSRQISASRATKIAFWGSGNEVQEQVLKAESEPSEHDRYVFTVLRDCRAANPRTCRLI